MGLCYSRVDREEMVSRCKARKRYTKQFVRARQSLATAHSMYLRSLRSTGAALLNFANAEATRHHAPPIVTTRHHHPPPPPPPPPMSPLSSDTWTSTSFTASPVPPPTPPPPPPPPPAASGWDFWYPFQQPSRPTTEEEWEETTNTAASQVGPASEGHPPPPPSSGDSELALVVSRNSGKDLVEIMKELDEYFVRAAYCGGELSKLLEVPTSGLPSLSKGGKVYDNGCNLSPSIWSLGCSSQGWGSFNDDKLRSNFSGGLSSNGSHCFTAERLYAWEKKLYQEVKNASTIKIEHEKKVDQLRKLELKRADYVKTEKTKKEVEKFESHMAVASQAIGTTSAEITKLRENELYPQLLKLVEGLMCMWRSMYECHQVQTHIVGQLKYLNTIPSLEPTSEIHRQSTLQLEHEIQQWHLSFCNLVKSQHDYIQSLTGWLRLSMFQFNNTSSLMMGPTRIESRIYSLCEDWSQAVDRIPDKVASEGIKSFLTVIHAIVVQQEAEHRQMKKSESVFKELERRNNELRSLECKYGPSYSMLEGKNPVGEKRAKVATLRAKAEEEKSKQEKLVNVTRTTTLNNLQMGLPHMLQAVLGFSSVCMNAFESVYNQAKDMESNLKRLLP
ncbi:hypothetical protein SAY86_022957 [Trapa natans]|uniref:Uncharacterized protein n=1 Tax=Trapa natans TaxID=22666 RepID=A0AAN7LU84_TRANT|nr:hypothetical protein SAY86_022957 [Trapa natans]